MVRYFGEGKDSYLSVRDGGNRGLSCGISVGNLEYTHFLSLSESNIKYAQIHTV